MALVAIAFLLVARNRPATAPTNAAVATAPVVRGDLVSTRQLRGSVTYGPVTPVESAASGVITAITPVGSTVSRGQPLYSVNNQPVVLLYGDLPMWRRLAPGVTGSDVRELKENLVALGYTGFAIDTAYTEQTATAVRRWQKALGLPQTGAVEPGQVLVQPGAVRVAEHRSLKGSHTSGPILGVTGTTRMIQVPLVPADRALAKVGTEVNVVLPDGTRVVGKVTEVVAASATTNQPTDTQPTAQALIALADQARLGVAADAGAQVQFTVAKHTGVLSVPVLALLALQDGGYGVEVVDGDSTRIVTVEVGMFTSGRVEISGPGITAGQQVKVPAS
ncbi:peptidoglycan-binding domain-containing protein [Dactylosporangium sp. NPDC051484]|uniref:peptidoglycan-binding domain-containing protein n=1 Tax=Dactylosporangium sp. NPDC051484 TaxID=3154942 RepID=UPI00345017CA